MRKIFGCYCYCEKNIIVNKIKKLEEQFVTQLQTYTETPTYAQFSNFQCGPRECAKSMTFINESSRTKNMCKCDINEHVHW